MKLFKKYTVLLFGCLLVAVTPCLAQNGETTAAAAAAAASKSTAPTPSSAKKKTARAAATRRAAPRTKPVPARRSVPTVVANRSADAQPASESQPVPKIVSKGVLNGSATNLARPSYPPAALAVQASGAVNVQVIIDEAGDVISAVAVSGHPLLRASAVQAARASTFKPTVLSGQPVKVTGIIVYNFVGQ
jgi:TonB family protein